MLHARPGQYRVTDFQTRGQPNLTWYNRYKQYETVVFDDAEGLPELLVPGGVKNAGGQIIIDVNNLNPKNEVRDASNWYIEALTGTPPVIRGGAYAEERQDDLVEVVKEMVRISCVVGHGLLTVSEQSLEIVSGTNIFPIQEPGNPIPDGWVMFWPYYLRPESDRGQLSHVTIPNRLKVKIWMANGEQTQATYMYNGGVIGDPAPEAEDDPEITHVSVFGVDEGFYKEALKYAGEIARLDAVIREVSTTYALPMGVVNASVGLITGTGLVDLQGRPLVANKNNMLQSLEPQGKPIEFVQAQIITDKLNDERMEWRKRFHAVTRIPMEITEQQDTEISGVSRALLARPAIDWMESTQRSITQALDAAIESITDTGGLEINWARQPFDTLAERRIVAREGFRDNIITLNEAREQIGEEAVEGGDLFFFELTGGRDGEPRGDNQQGTGNQTGERGQRPGPRPRVRDEGTDRRSNRGGNSSGNRSQTPRGRATRRSAND